uniref:DPEP2 neighbor n=1 Tax=Propithecus coquereli TaxID=379532 RepID=A0A2K6FS57_PROCO
MSDRILYLNSNLSSVPWEGCMAAPPPPACPPVYYHLLYRGCGEAQVGWHGETYCLGGGYRLFGDAPLATPAKAEAEKPAPRRAPKRHRAVEEGEKDLGCPSPKIQSVQHRARRLTCRKVAG